MKNLSPAFLILGILLNFSGNVHATGNSEIEKNLFTTIVKEGAYVHPTYTSPEPTPGSGSFYLDSISCETEVQSNEYSCSFLDVSRPVDKKKFTGESAKMIYENLAASGIVPKAPPFQHGRLLAVGASKLQCTMLGYGERVNYSCMRLKPLVE
jgi:hypothetical protein